MVLEWLRNRWKEIAMMFVFLLLAVGVVAVVLWWFRSGKASDKSIFPRSDGDSPFEILNRRYASGVIDREEYENIRNNLLGK